MDSYFYTVVSRFECDLHAGSEGRERLRWSEIHCSNYFGHPRFLQERKGRDVVRGRRRDGLIFTFDGPQVFGMLKRDLVIWIKFEDILKRGFRKRPLPILGVRVAQTVERGDISITFFKKKRIDADSKRPVMG